MLEIGGVTVIWAFAAGVVSFLSPCVLPIVPGYLSYVAGHSMDELVEPGLHPARLAALGRSAGFVAGFSAVFIALGASASGLGRLLLSYRGQADLVAGIIIAAFGLNLMGLLRIPMLARDWRVHGDAPRASAWGAFLLGAAFAFGWTPCIGPILGSILTLGAIDGTVREGVVLLAVYSSGLAVPFLLTAAFTGTFMRRVRVLRSAGQTLRIAAGGVLVVVGILMAMGLIESFGTWLLATFPGFQTLLI